MNIKHTLEYEWWLDDPSGAKSSENLSAPTRFRLSEIATRGIADLIKQGYVEGELTSSQPEGICRGWWKLKRIY